MSSQPRLIMKNNATGYSHNDEIANTDSCGVALDNKNEPGTHTKMFVETSDQEEIFPLRL